MITDKQRIENVIIPGLLFEMADLHSKGKPEYVELFAPARRVLTDVVKTFLNTGDEKKDSALKRRFGRVLHKFIDYYHANRFDTRKGFLALTAWAFLLDEADALHIENKEYADLLIDLDSIIGGGYAEVEGFDKIHDSALKHVTKVHKIAQSEGYFTEVLIKEQ